MCWLHKAKFDKKMPESIASSGSGEWLIRK